MNDRVPPAILIPPRVAVVGELDEARVDDYWRAVRETLRRVFGEDNAASVARSARERLEVEATSETQQIFYHASPFQVAADLAGASENGLTERQLSSYREIIADFDPTLYSSAP